MDLSKFDSLPQPHQSITEWRSFMEFAVAYLQDRGVVKPLVLEVGTYQNAQRPFYQEYMNADHIGIDIEAVNSTPDVMGDSNDPATLLKLKEVLGGREIDLVFIDAHHGYDSVKNDYWVYGSLAKHMVAFHDIYTPTVEVVRFWQDLLKETDKTTVEFRSPKSYMGIGVVLR